MKLTFSETTSHPNRVVNLHRETFSSKVQNRKTIYVIIFLTSNDWLIRLERKRGEIEVRQIHHLNTSSVPTSLFLRRFCYTSCVTFFNKINYLSRSRSIVYINSVLFPVLQSCRFLLADRKFYRQVSSKVFLQIELWLVVSD